jgi:hypothetical protein
VCKYNGTLIISQLISNKYLIWNMIEVMKSTSSFLWCKWCQYHNCQDLCSYGLGQLGSIRILSGMAMGKKTKISMCFASLNFIMIYC